MKLGGSIMLVAGSASLQSLRGLAGAGRCPPTSRTQEGVSGEAQKSGCGVSSSDFGAQGFEFSA